MVFTFQHNHETIYKYLYGGAGVGERRVEKEGQQIHDSLGGVLFQHDISMISIQSIVTDLKNINCALR